MTYIDNGPAWWHVLLLAAAGGVIALLARDGWAWLVSWWADRKRTPGPTADTTADDPQKVYDDAWRDRGKIPAVPDAPTEVVAKWWHTKHALHRWDCPHAQAGEPLPSTYTVEQAAIEAKERKLRPCRSCNPLDPRLDDDQVLALTYDDVEQLIKLRMAEDGIPILPMPIEPEYIPVAGADQTVYEVAGLGFRDRDAAEAVLAAINRNAASRVKGTYDYTNTGDYSTRFVEVDDGEQSVTTRMYYSQESYAASKEALGQNALGKADYEAQRREYDKAERDAKGIREQIHDRIAEVGTMRRRGEFLAERFREYLSIAAGDALMAMQFLVKAHDLTDEEIAELRRVEARAGHNEIDQVPEAVSP